MTKNNKRLNSIVLNIFDKYLKGVFKDEGNEYEKFIDVFGIPGISIFFMFDWGYEKLINWDIPVHWSTFMCLWGPMLIMISFVLVRFFMSGLDFTNYFSIGKLNKKQVLIVIGAFLVVQILEALLSFSRPLLASLQGFQVPSYYPDIFRLDMELKVPLETFLGMKLKGNTFPIFFWLLWLIINIGCEELLWRGYALPRMEKFLADGHGW